MALQFVVDAACLCSMERMSHPRLRLKHGWRALRTILYLAIRPQDIFPYLKFGALTQKTPLDIGMPWWSFGSVTAVSARVNPNHDVFEFGSGGSTLYLARRARSVTCVEHDGTWADELERAASRTKLENVCILRRKLDPYCPQEFDGSSYLLALGGRKFDVIVVDGAEGDPSLREKCFWRAEDYVNRGGMIIVDDAWRYPRLKSENRSLRWTEYKGAGFCRRGVTSTCVFDY